MNMKKKKIVILGAGFGGAYAARELDKAFSPGQVDIYLIDMKNHFLFFPFLAEAGTGRLEPRHSVIAIRRFLKNTQFMLGEVVNVNTEDQVVEFSLTGDNTENYLTYDHIILSPGSTSKMPPIDGLEEHAFTMKSLNNAVALRDRAITLLELADIESDPETKRSLLHFVVVGANYTGIEVAGEYESLLRSAAKEYRNISPDDIRVTVVEIADRIIPALEEGLAEYAYRQLQKRKLEFKLETTVEKIEPDKVHLDNGEVLDAQTVIWTAGIAPHPSIKKFGLPTDDRGYILTNSPMQVKGFDNVWAVGDAAVNIDGEGNPYPPTAQHATLLAKHLAKNIARFEKGMKLLPAEVKSKGTLAALGQRTAVAKVFGMTFTGFIAWFLWRSVYLFKMPGIKRKARVAIDWTLDMFFRRDHVQLGLHGKMIRTGSRREQQDAREEQPMNEEQQQS